MKNPNRKDWIKMVLVSDKLMNVMICPVDKGDLEERTEESVLVCKSCSRRYPIRLGMPIMVVGDDNSVKNVKRY